MPNMTGTNRMTAYERETIVNANDEDEFAIVTTYQRSRITQLRKNTAAVENLDFKGRAWGGAQFTLPANLVSFRNPRKQSAESKARVADRMARARAARKDT